METSVYVLRNAFGEAIYIGVSSNVDNRVAQHRRRVWGRNINSFVVVWTGSREEALVREAELIGKMRPKLNKTHNSDAEKLSHGQLRVLNDVRCLQPGFSPGTWRVVV